MQKMTSASTTEMAESAPSYSSHLDPKGMVDLARGFPDQLAHALERDLPDLSSIDADAVRQVVFLGMGGSGASGGFGRVLLDQAGRVMSRSLHDYEVPDWVGPDTLVIATSFSGNTEETLEALAECRDRGTPWVAITSGGALAEAAKHHGAPLVLVPEGTEPRAMFGHLLGALLRVLAEVGLLEDMTVRTSLEDALERCRALAQECDPETPEAANPAKQLARALQGKTVLVMADEPYGPVVERIRCQFNENGKVLSFTRLLPEANHNDTVAWGADPWVHTWTTLWVGPFDRNEALAERAAFVQNLLRDRGIPVHSMDLPDETDPLARMIALTYLGDWVSIYLAFQNGRDPGDVAVIPRLKERLKRTGVMDAAMRRLGIGNGA